MPAATMPMQSLRARYKYGSAMYRSEEFARSNGTARLYDFPLICVGLIWTRRARRISLASLLSHRAPVGRGASYNCIVVIELGPQSSLNNAGIAERDRRQPSYTVRRHIWHPGICARMIAARRNRARLN